jgi:hypothetical protein
MNTNTQKKLTVWDVFEEYADVRDELESLMDTFEYIQAEMEFAIEDINNDLQSIKKQLRECDKVFRRFKVQRANMSPSPPKEDAVNHFSDQPFEKPSLCCTTTGRDTPCPKEAGHA